MIDVPLNDAHENMRPNGVDENVFGGAIRILCWQFVAVHVSRLHVTTRQNETSLSIACSG